MLLLTSCFRDASDILPDSAVNQWRTIGGGLEDRTLQVGDNAISQLYILRVDPTYYRFEAHYTPNTAYYIEEWEAQLPDATIIVNANLFDINNAITGLLIRDGVIFGRSYTDRGGTFAIKNNFPFITHNIYEPFDTTGAQHAIQGFPVLVYNGVAAFERFGNASRRTVIGQDGQGRILIIVTPIFGPSLNELSAFLANSDLGLVNAINLDGGGSTMLYVENITTVRSFDRVPAVLAIYPIGG
jgi:exopolysaccharide biosynthesis protein